MDPWHIVNPNQDDNMPFMTSPTAFAAEVAVEVKIGFFAVGGKLPAYLDLLKEGVDGRRGAPGCAHTHDVGGKLVVVNQSISRTEVSEEFLGCYWRIPNIFVM